jgi:glycosyltransferase involved in cell wall biosynthesis
LSEVSGDRDPVVSVILPARNEETCLALCLESLVSQTGIDFEIIVVDDASRDRTAEIARSFSNVTVVSAPPLPNNWTGKNNAMSAGAKIAHSKVKWLLFTDADTVHKPGSLSRAVIEAEQHGAALLSYSPEQQVRTFWERAVMPVIFAELAGTYPPKKVNDPASNIAAANGQYLMISREVYDAVGGHTKIAGDLLEDVAMARLVKSSGRKIFFRYGGDAVRTRMYRSWPQMKEGWTKNLALLFNYPLRRALVLLAIWAFSWATFAFGLAAIVSGHWKLAYYLLPLFFLYGRIARSRFRPATNFAAIMFGVPAAAYLLFISGSVRKSGGVLWKDRIYRKPEDWSPHSLGIGAPNRPRSGYAAGPGKLASRLSVRRVLRYFSGSA